MNPKKTINPKKRGDKMKKGKLLVIMAMLAISSTALAQQRFKGHGRDAKKRFEKMDANADGSVSREEMISHVEQCWQTLDVDNNGIVTSEEMVQARKAKGEERFSKKDLNGDGYLTPDELEKMPEKWFNKIDANGDGQLSPTELNARFDGKRHGKRGGKHLASIDTDGNGQVSEKELLDHANQRFDKMDKNGDGLITPEELKHNRNHKSWKKKDR